MKHWMICVRAAARICESPCESRFWRCYRDLPQEVQRLADQCYQLLKNDPHHPSLHLKKIERFWSVRVGLHYRALAADAKGELVWFWIGSHADYDKLLGRKKPPNPPLQPPAEKRGG